MANILASGASAATSTDVTLADGATANLSLMVASGSIPAAAEAIVFVDTSGIDVEVDRLTNAKRTVKITGPGTYRVYRIPGPTFGVDSL